MSSTQVLFACAAVTAVWLLVRRFRHNELLSRLPGPPSSSFITGNLLDFFSPQGWNFHWHLIQDYGQVIRLSGIFNEPMLYIFDPQALDQLLVKDSGAIDEPEEFLAFMNMMTGSGMLSMPAHLHRRQRKIISPAFAPNHIRAMLPLFYRISERLQKAIASQVTGGLAEVDMQHWFARAASEFIGQAGIGLSLDPLAPGTTEDEYVHNLKSIVPLFLEMPALQQLLPYAARWVSMDFLRTALQYVPNKRVQEFGRLSSYLVKHAEEIYQDKKRALEQEVERLEGKDIISILMRANSSASEKDRISETEVIGQLTLFIAAGTDTTAQATSRVFHHLAMRPDIQQKIREEFAEARRDGFPNYEDIMQLPWLNAVVRETLRFNAPAPYIVRIAIKDTFLPLSRPIVCTDGKTVTEVPIPKGTKLFIGTYGSNLNKDIWGDDAMEWKPERWFSELPSATNAIPSVYANLLTFNAGVRSCPGFKFAELEIKITTCMLLSQFKFEVSDKPLYWNLGQVYYPTTEVNSKEGSMPLKVSFIKEIRN